MSRKIILSSALAILTFAIFSLNLVSAWYLNGTVYDTNGNALGGSNITVNAMYAPGGTQPTFFTPLNYTVADSNGNFLLNVTDNSSFMYQIKILHINTTFNKVDYIGSTLPHFPFQEVSRNMSTNFFLKPAGTINITAINSTGRITFNYQLKDTTLGYTIDSSFTDGGYNESIIYVPRDRNYSVMIYPNGMSMPLIFNWNNFSSQNSYNFGNDLSSYNATTKVVQKQFNTTMNLVRYTGYINGSSVGALGFDNITIVPYLLQPGNMVFLSDSGYGTMPYNMSAWNCPGGNCQSDVYSSSDGLGFYNITLPGPAEDQTLLLYVSAINGTGVYGAYKNISINYSSSQTQYNFTTLYGLLGELSNLTMQTFTQEGAGTQKVLVKKKIFNFVNKTDNASVSFSTEAHIEVSLDYTNYGATSFVMTVSTSSNARNFSLPLLNVTGVKEINIFSQQFAPKRVSTMSVSQIAANNNISLTTFSPQTIDGSRSGASVAISMFKSNSSCDIPSPALSCYAVGGPGQTMANFNPLSAIIGGGKISFRMSLGNVTVHYVNVDMLASGPPEALFESNDNVTEKTTGGFGKIMKFGSGGPTIYDYVLISMPYTDGSLNESQAVNISVPYFYDENWNVIWNVSSNGTSSDSLAGNDSHYSAKSTEWATLMTGKECTNSTITSSSQINTTNPCYIDLTNNLIWVRIPHFSGTGPQVSGSSTESTTTTTTTTTSSSTGGASAVWIVNFYPTNADLTTGYTKEYSEGYRTRFKVNNSYHDVGIIDIKATNVTINVSSTPQQAVFNIGDEKKFDVNADGYYDVYVKLNSITGTKANITIKTIYEKITSQQTGTGDSGNTGNSGNAGDSGDATSGSGGKNLTGMFWMYIGVLVVVIIIIGLVAYKFYRKRRYHKKGY